MRTRREGGVKGIPKADRTWISGTREKESNGPGGWRFISRDGESVGRTGLGRVSEVYKDNTRAHRDRQGCLWRERSEERCVHMCDSQLGLSVTECPSLHH